MTRQTREEISELNNAESLPLHANWRQLLTALGEKRAVLASLRANPFAKALDTALKDAEAAVEALTRSSLAISAISR